MKVLRFLSLLLLAAGLSMDAFAASLCKGLAVRSLRARQALAVGGIFGFFQAAMPLVGYCFAQTFRAWIEQVDHWVAFLLLAFLGLRMIAESRANASEEVPRDGENRPFSLQSLLPPAFATSVDALAVGVAFALSGTYRGILFTVSVIGVVTFALCCVGVYVGNLCGTRFRAKAELVGGLLLLLIGTRILLADLGVLPGG